MLAETANVVRPLDVAELFHRSFDWYLNYLTLRIFPGPRSWTCLIPLTIAPAALCCWPSVLPTWVLRWMLFPAILAIQISIWHRYNCFDVISVNSTLGAFMLLCWFDVRRDFQRILPNHAASEEKNVRLYPFPLQLGPRILWVQYAIASQELNGWLIGHRSHDCRELALAGRARTAIQVTRHTLLWAAVHYAVIEAVEASRLLHSNANFVLQPDTDAEPSFFFNIATLGALLALLYSAIRLYVFHLPVLMTILAALVYPALWRHPFLSPLSRARDETDPRAIWSPTQSIPSWGCRRFWAHNWHQNQRYLTAVPGLALAHGIGLRSPSFARYAVIVITAFFFSGIMHMGVVPPKPLWSSMTATQLRILMGSFFWCQPIGILIESGIDQAFGLLVPIADSVGNGQGDESGSRLKRESRPWQLRPFPRLCMLIWTVAFLSTSVWYSGRIVGRELGLWSVHLSPVSLISWVRAILLGIESGFR